MAICSSCHCTGINDEIILWQLCQGQTTQRTSNTQLSTPYTHCLHSILSRNNGASQMTRMGFNGNCGSSRYSMITNLLYVCTLEAAESLTIPLHKVRVIFTVA